MTAVFSPCGWGRPWENAGFTEQLPNSMKRQGRTGLLVRVAVRWWNVWKNSLSNRRLSRQGAGGRAGVNSRGRRQMGALGEVVQSLCGLLKYSRRPDRRWTSRKKQRCVALESELYSIGCMAVFFLKSIYFYYLLIACVGALRGQRHWVPWSWSHRGL